jgi:hypothetical protein
MMMHREADKALKGGRTTTTHTVFQIRIDFTVHHRSSVTSSIDSFSNPKS